MKTTADHTIRLVEIMMVVLIVACATPYQPRGWTGGYSGLQLVDNTFRVHFRGNAYTAPERVEAFALFRYAELTIRNGYDYFVANGTSESQSMFGDLSLPGGYGTSTSMGLPMTPSRHSISLLCKAFRGKRPDDSYDARTLIGRLRSQIRDLPTTDQ
jgi:hypothetical protein